MMTRLPDTTGPGDRRVKSGTAKTKFAEIVVVCSKCAKRQGLRPRAVRTLLMQAAKTAAKTEAKTATKRAVQDGRASQRTKLCIVESGCLGPCPKHAVAVATGASLAAGRVVLLDPKADPQAALAAVLRPVLPQCAIPEFGPNTALAAIGPAESVSDS